MPVEKFVFVNKKFLNKQISWDSFKLIFGRLWNIYFPDFSLIFNRSLELITIFKIVITHLLFNFKELSWGLENENTVKVRGWFEKSYILREMAPLVHIKDIFSKQPLLYESLSYQVILDYKFVWNMQVNKNFKSAWVC